MKCYTPLIWPRKSSHGVHMRPVPTIQWTTPRALQRALRFSSQGYNLACRRCLPCLPTCAQQITFFCSEVTNDRSYLRVGYVSEPALAEAACRCWSNELVLGRVLDHLLVYTKRTNTYCKGNMGELVAMAILCLAWTKACDLQRTTINPEQDGCFPYSRLLTVKAYLDALLGNGNYIDLHESLSNGVVYFSHFCKVHYTPSKNTLLDFFRRGAGIISKTGERGIDLIIPVILRYNGYELKEASLAFILVQVKNRKAVDKVTKDVIFEKMRPTKRSPHSGTHPYVALVMELGLKPGRISAISHSSSSATVSQICVQTHYDIYVAGMNKEVYPSIPEAILKKFYELLVDPLRASRRGRTYGVHEPMNAYDAASIKRM